MDGYWPLAPYADIELAEADHAPVIRVQAVKAGLRMPFPDFIEFHDRHRQYHIDSDRSQFCAFARGFFGPGNLTLAQWYAAWDAWINLQDAHDERDTQECAADVAVQ